MSEFEKPNFQFVILEHIRKIGEISRNLGQRTGLGLDNYSAAIDFLEDTLFARIDKDLRPLLNKRLNAWYKDALEKKDKAETKDEPFSIKRDYQLQRQRFRIFVDLLTDIGWLGEEEAIGT